LLRPARHFNRIYFRFLISFVILAVLDFGFAIRTKSRWFVLHGVYNMIISVLTLPDLWTSIRRPSIMLLPESGSGHWPLVLVSALHLWHMLAYSGLTWDDYYHHIVFAGSLCLVGLRYQWGALINFFIFFVCGFPGGVDYLLLACVKHNYIRKIDEKRWNAYINTWCRAPGIVFAGSWGFASWMEGAGVQIPWFIKLMALALGLMNGQYYGRRVVASWAVHELRHQDERKSDMRKSGRKPSSTNRPHNPLQRAEHPSGFASMAFSPSTRQVVAESYTTSLKNN